MKNFYLKISSKNKEALKYFSLNLFYRINKKQNFKSIKRYKNLTPKIKKISLLKSPHIYKYAQEQFEFRVFKKKFDFLVTNYKKFLIFLKKVKINRFFDVNVKLLFKIKKFNNFFINTYFKKNLNYFIIDNFFLKTKNKNVFFFISKENKDLYFFINEKKKIAQIQKFFNIKIKTSKHFLKILDILGEKQFVK